MTSRRTLRWVEDEIRRHERCKSLLALRYEEFSFIGGGGERVNQRTTPGDPTASAALHLLWSREMQYLGWLVSGIAEAMAEWSDRMLIIYHEHFRRGRSIDYVAAQMDISRTKAYHLRARMVKSVIKSLGIPDD